MRPPLRNTAVVMIAMVVGMAYLMRVSKGDDARLAAIETDWRSTRDALVRRAESEGSSRLAQWIAAWSVPLEHPSDGRQWIPRISDEIVVPEWLAGFEGSERAIWNDFLQSRRERAEAVFAMARDAAEDGRGCEAFRLLGLALVENPSHGPAREAGGWVRREHEGREEWIWPEVAARLDRGQSYSPDHGWLLRSWRPHYDKGQRRVGGRWVNVEEVAPPASIQEAPEWQSNHWRIHYFTSERQASSLAAAFEETHDVWWQVFGAFALEPVELRRRFVRGGQVSARESMQSVMFVDRSHYERALKQLEPRIGDTLGIYWRPLRTTYFFDGDMREATTIHHEATHQLFAESRRTSPLVGERCGFWATEAVACYMESLERVETGWRLGGRDHGRAPKAAERLLEDDFYVPLEQLTALGRVDFQADPRLPQIYSQISGLADFFINGERGRYREAFVEYLVQIYKGSASPETLARLCERRYDELDMDYRRHMSR